MGTKEKLLTLKLLEIVNVDQAHGFAPLLPEYLVKANSNISVHISDGNGFNVFGWGSKGSRRRVPEKLAYGRGRRRIAVPVELIEEFREDCGRVETTYSLKYVGYIDMA